MVMMSKADIEAVIKDKEQIEQSIREHIEALNQLPRLNSGVYSEKVKKTSFYKYHRKELNTLFKRLKSLLDELPRKQKETIQLYQ